MTDYAPPSGPPPPKAPQVPAGWAARWNEQYKEWFYVNVYTKKSQWEKPTAPVYPPDDKAHDDPPPGYEPASGPAPTDAKQNPYEDRSGPAPSAAAAADDDAKLAAKLQAEEDVRARAASPGAGAQPPPSYGGQHEPFPQELPPRDRDSRAKGGFLGKLFGKDKAPAGQQQGYSAYSPQPHQGYYQSPPPQQQYGGYPSQAYGGPPYCGRYGSGAYGGQPGYAAQQQQPPRKNGMGAMGMGLGGAALGLGAGVLGGAMIADVIHDHEQEAYMDGFEDGQDFGGGDFGGDF